MTHPTTLRRRSLLGLAATTAAGSLGLPFAGAARAADTVKLKLSSFEPPMANITSNVLTPFAREASAGSGGALQIDIFAGGTLGRNPAQQLKLVTDGIADIAWVVLAYTPGRFDDTEIVGLPFLTQNATESCVALHQLYDKGALVGFDGLRVLALGATPPVAVHGNTPVRLPTDLNSKRVRVSGSHLTRVVEALGGAPVALNAGQIAEGLSRGVVDMTLNNWGFVGDFKVDEVSSEHLSVPLGAVAVAVVMRQDKYESLPPAARTAIDKASGLELARKLGVAFDRQEIEVRDKVAHAGKAHVLTPSADEMATWKAAIEPVNQTWLQAKPRNERIHAAFVEQLQQVRSRA